MAYDYNPSCYIKAAAGELRVFNYIGVYDYTNQRGEQVTAGIAVVAQNVTEGMRGMGAYFKNIPNEINDFDGYCAIAIDENKPETNMQFSYTAAAEDAKCGTVVLSVDGKPLRIYIAELRDTDNNTIVPRGGVNLGKIEMKVPLTASQSIMPDETDDGGVGANSIFYAIDAFMRRYNPTIDSSVTLKNNKNSFSVKLGEKNGLLKILNIENLSFSSEEISGPESAYADGDIITNSKAIPRDVEIELEPDSDHIDAAIQSVFAELYKKEAYIQWETTRWLNDWYSKNWKLKGKVNEISAPRFDEKVTINILLHCSNPFWQGETVSFNVGYGGMIIAGDEISNIHFFRTKSQNTGIRINITTDGFMEASIAGLPKRSDITISLYTFEDLLNRLGRTLLQKMEFTGTYGELQQNPGAPDALSYDIDITTEFRNKNAVENITETNMLDDLTSDSEFLIVNHEVCEIDFNDLFNSEFAALNPYVTVSYTPLFVG